MSNHSDYRFDIWVLGTFLRISFKGFLKKSGLHAWLGLTLSVIPPSLVAVSNDALAGRLSLE